ncbi:MAG: hypothetical protein WCJ95_04145 [Mariniphaga sp.]
MNGLIKRVLLFLTITSFFPAQMSFGQNLDELVVFSNLQYEKGNFELAANEYNRALFFGYKSEDRLCLKIANCYFNLNKLEQSEQFYDRAYFSTNSDSIRTEAVLGKSFSLILEKKFIIALSELMNLDTLSLKSQSIKLDFLKGIAYFGMHQDSLAETSFLRCARGFSDEEGASVLRKDFGRIKKVERRFKPGTAWRLSLVLPGSGQVYSGNYREAANSALLMGGFAYLTVSIALEYTFVEALVVAASFFQRYWVGGANKAEKLAFERQNRERNSAYLSIMKILEDADKKNSRNPGCDVIAN